jgi:Cyclin, N-terminal domain
MSSTLSLKGILIHHEISSKLRARMVDWMIEVLSIFCSSLESLFGAVLIMDRYLQLTPKKLAEEKIHLIGITSMLMASKLYDVRSLEVNEACDQISRSKYSPNDIKQMEREIAEILKWDFWSPSVLILVRTLICNLEHSLILVGKEEDAKTKLILESVISTAEKFALISLYDSCFIQEFSTEKIAQSCILRGLKKVRKVMLQNSVQIGRWQKWFKSTYGCYESCISEIGRIEKRLIDLSLLNYQKFSYSH